MTGRLRNVVLALVVAIGGLALALEFSARREATRIAAALEPLATLRYESAGTTWNGSLRLIAPQLEIRAGPWRGVVRARLATLRGDGRWWTLARGVSDEGGLPPQARIEVHGLELSPATGTANGSGSVEAWLHAPGHALFETQGCPDEALGVVERQRMGVPASERFDRFNYRLDTPSGRLELDFTLEQPGVAALDGSLEINAFTPASANFPVDVRLVQAELDYRDPGYLAVRNTLCAQRLGIGTEPFIERHVAAVDELLGTYGITLGDSVRAVYRQLVSEGGTLKLTVLPDATWLPADVFGTPRGELLRVLNATARHADAPPVMLQLAFADPGAAWFAEDASVGEPVTTGASAGPQVTETPAAAVTEATAIEPSFVPAASATMPEVAAAPPISTPRPTSTPEAARASSIAGIPAAAATPAPPVAVSVPDSAVFESPRAITADTVSPPNDALAVDPREPARELGASAPPPPKDSTLALVWKPGVIERLEAREAPARDYRVIAAAEIGAHRGRRVRLLTAGGKLVDGEFRGIDSGQALLRVRAASGTADVAVPLANVREIRLVVGSGR